MVIRMHCERSLHDFYSVDAWPVTRANIIAAFIMRSMGAELVKLAQKNCLKRILIHLIGNEVNNVHSRSCDGKCNDVLLIQTALV